MVENQQKNSTFTEYGLQPSIMESLEILKYHQPTQIQQLVIPEALAGQDIAAKSKTGSGKTAAFGIPICEKIQWEENLPQALVLEPTRELAVQVKEELSLIGRNKRLKVADVFGGFPIDKQIRTLKQKTHIVVATPGRLIDHIERNTVDLSKVQILVIDEADLMLDMGFISDVEAILGQVPKGQRMLFSATLGEGLQGLMEQYMNHPRRIEIQEDIDQVQAICQGVICVPGEEENSNGKYQALLNTLIQEQPRSGIIFCGTKEMANVLARKLHKDGIRCGLLHGDIDQQDRLRTIDGFRIGKFPILIATDVAARGIDFDNLSLVFNYDFPTGRETYVHRIGRTGRNGAIGRAVSLITPEETYRKKQVEDYLGYEIPIEEMPEPDQEMRRKFAQKQQKKEPLKKRKGSDFKETITTLYISGGKKSKMRAGDIVGTICSIQGLTAEDIGVIDIRDSLTYVDIMNGKGDLVYQALQKKTIKGKLRKVKKSRKS